jgi:hypothetical protein
MDRTKRDFNSHLVLLIIAILVSTSCGNTSSTGATSTPPTSTPQTNTDISTYRNDPLRTGQNLTETVLTPNNVKSSSFGKLLSVLVDGKVDAQPLYVSQSTIPRSGTRSVVYAATEHDSVYAFDATSGQVFWHVTLVGTGEALPMIEAAGR